MLNGITQRQLAELVGSRALENHRYPHPPSFTPGQMAALTPSDEILTKAELALKLKVSTRTIETWQSDRVLPFLKISTVILFYWPDVMAHLNTNYRICPSGSIRAHDPSVLDPGRAGDGKNN